MSRYGWWTCGDVRHLCTKGGGIHTDAALPCGNDPASGRSRSCRGKSGVSVESGLLLFCFIDFSISKRLKVHDIIMFNQDTWIYMVCNYIYTFTNYRRNHDKEVFTHQESQIVFTVGFLRRKWRTWSKSCSNRCKTFLRPMLGSRCGFDGHGCQELVSSFLEYIDILEIQKNIVMITWVGFRLGCLLEVLTVFPISIGHEVPRCGFMSAWSHDVRRRESREPFGNIFGNTKKVSGWKNWKFGKNMKELPLESNPSVLRSVSFGWRHVGLDHHRWWLTW